MKISIPNLQKDMCETFIVYSQLTTDDTLLLEWADKHSVASQKMYETPEGVLFTRVKLNTWKNSIQIHVDIASQKFFEKRTRTPSIEAGTPSIEELLAPFMGHELATSITSVFGWPVKKAPPIVLAFYGIPDLGTPKIKMTGGTFSVKESLLKSLSWKIDEKISEAEVTFEASNTLLISESYLCECYLLMESLRSGFMEPTP